MKLQPIISSRGDKDLFVKVHHIITSRGIKDPLVKLQCIISSRDRKDPSMKAEHLISLRGAKDPSMKVQHKRYYKERVSPVKQNIWMIVQNYISITFIGKLQIILTIIKS